VRHDGNDIRCFRAAIQIYDKARDCAKYGRSIEGSGQHAADLGRPDIPGDMILPQGGAQAKISVFGRNPVGCMIADEEYPTARTQSYRGCCFPNLSLQISHAAGQLD
jgi:hypothetical protein